MRKYAKKVTWALLYRGGTAITRVGERLDIGWLIYNPLVFIYFHLGNRMIGPGIFEIFRELFPEARRYADVGAGTGGIAAYGRRSGLDVEACEQSRLARWMAARQGVPSAPFDLYHDPPARLDAPYDVAYCFEVAEHVDPSLSSDLIAFLRSIAPRVVFSAAPPGQGGHGHINEQPEEYWISLFEEAGFRLSGTMTTRMRSFFAAHDYQIEWLINNVLVFESQDR